MTPRRLSPRDMGKSVSYKESSSVLDSGSGITPRWEGGMAPLKAKGHLNGSLASVHKLGQDKNDIQHGGERGSQQSSPAGLAGRCCPKHISSFTQEGLSRGLTTGRGTIHKVASAN